MATPEGTVKKKIRALLSQYEKVHVDMPVQNGMGRPMLDYHGCCNGRYFAIEAKASGKKPTPRQEATIAGLLACGAVVFVIDGDESMESLRAFLNVYSPGKKTGGAKPAPSGDGA